MYFGLFSLGGGEIFIILLAVLVLFGASKIPDLARTLGKGMNEFRKATDDLKREFREETSDLRSDFEQGKAEVDSHIREISKTVSDKEPYNSTTQVKAGDTLLKNSEEISGDAIEPKSLE